MQKVQPPDDPEVPAVQQVHVLQSADQSQLESTVQGPHAGPPLLHKESCKKFFFNLFINELYVTIVCIIHK